MSGNFFQIEQNADLLPNDSERLVALGGRGEIETWKGKPRADAPSAPSRPPIEDIGTPDRTIAGYSTAALTDSRACAVAQREYPSLEAACGWAPP